MGKHKSLLCTSSLGISTSTAGGDERLGDFSIVESRNRKKNDKKITIREGILHLEPRQKPNDGHFQVFLLTKVMWIPHGVTDTSEICKLLEPEIAFARDVLGFSFVEEDIIEGKEKEVQFRDVVAATLQWVKGVAPTTFQRMQHTQRDDKTVYTKVAGAKKQTPAELPAVVMQLQSFAPNQTDQRSGAQESRPEGSCSILEEPAQQREATKRKFSHRAEEPEPGKLAKVEGKDEDTNQAVSQERSRLWGEGRSLSELQKELEEKHPAGRRPVDTNDVVAGRGETAKQRNEPYRELIRAWAPIFRFGMNTGDPDKNLEAKRKLAYRLALTVVNRGGCFRDVRGEPVCPKKAFKRVMTSLKDWRPPGEKKKQRSSNKLQKGKATPKPKQRREAVSSKAEETEHPPPPDADFDCCFLGSELDSVEDLVELLP